ncbi:hypothetical protein B296_00052204, partial [Ensete ventricosum]
PASPRRSPRIHRRGGKTGGGRGATLASPRPLAQRMVWMLLSLLLRRQAIFLFAPLLYVSAMIFYMGTLPLESVPRIISRPAPGSVYRSPMLYERLRADMEADNSSDGLATVWKHSFKDDGWRPCVNTSADGKICNAVAVAGYLNATLVIPYFPYHSIWRDPRLKVLVFITYFSNKRFMVLFSDVFDDWYSKFNDIYDKDHFISTLINEVRVVDKVPEFLMERFGNNMSNVFNFKIKAWSSIQYYKDAILPKLAEEK